MTLLNPSNVSLFYPSLLAACRSGYVSVPMLNMTRVNVSLSKPDIGFCSVYTTMDYVTGGSVSVAGGLGLLTLGVGFYELENILLFLFYRVHGLPGEAAKELFEVGLSLVAFSMFVSAYLYYLVPGTGVLSGIWALFGYLVWFVAWDVFWLVFLKIFGHRGFGMSFTFALLNILSSGSMMFSKVFGGGG
jgi:hypothetical protein